MSQYYVDAVFRKIVTWFSLALLVAIYLLVLVCFRYVGEISEAKPQLAVLQTNIETMHADVLKLQKTARPVGPLKAQELLNSDTAFISAFNGVLQGAPLNKQTDFDTDAFANALVSIFHVVADSTSKAADITERFIDVAFAFIEGAAGKAGERTVDILTSDTKNQLGELSQVLLERREKQNSPIFEGQGELEVMSGKLDELLAEHVDVNEGLLEIQEEVEDIQGEMSNLEDILDEISDLEGKVTKIERANANIERLIKKTHPSSIAVGNTYLRTVYYLLNQYRGEAVELQLTDIAIDLKKKTRGRQCQMFVYGYTDTTGTDNSNYQLSEKRAEHAASILEKAGFKVKEVKGYSERKLQTMTLDEVQNKNNRRVDVRLVCEH